MARVEREIDARGVAVFRSDSGLVGRRRLQGVYRADRGLLEDPPLDPRDREVLSRNQRLLVLAVQIGLLARPDLIEPDLVITDLPGHPRAVVDRNRLAGAQPDPSREERLCLTAGSEREGAGPLEEEVAALRKPDWEACEVHASLIALDLSEIGVERNGRTQAGCHAVIHIQAEIPREGRLIGVFGNVAPAHDRRRPRLETEPLGEILEAGQVPSEHGAPQSLVPSPSTPEDLLVPPTNRALEVDAPRIRGRVEVQRAEGDLNLG